MTRTGGGGVPCGGSAGCPLGDPRGWLRRGTIVGRPGSESCSEHIIGDAGVDHPGNHSSVRTAGARHDHFDHFDDDPATTLTTTDSRTERIPGPPAESTWMVVGVASDDVLNIRAAPSATSAVIGELAPTEFGVTSTGEAVAVSGSTWWQIKSDRTCGWVNARFLAAQGSTTDITSLIVELGAGLPAAASMEELALLVIGLLSGDGEQLVIVADAGADDLTDMSVDVFPEDMDDSVRGQRLRIFGQRDGGEGPYSLYGVEATSLCWRGADELGQCV